MPFPELGEHWKDVMVAGLASLGTLATAYFGYMGARAAVQKRRAEREIRIQSRALDFTEFLHEWSEVHAQITALMDETAIDRFLLLRAWNGLLAPKWTTAVMQIHQGAHTPMTYVHYELDADYVGRLGRIKHQGHEVIVTDDLPDCGIKAVYRNEGVTEAAWFHINSRRLTSDPLSQAVTYCSFGVHNGVIDENTLTRCHLIVGRLKGMVMDFILDREDEMQ